MLGHRVQEERAARQRAETPGAKLIEMRSGFRRHGRKQRTSGRYVNATVNALAKVQLEPLDQKMPHRTRMRSSRPGLSWAGCATFESFAALPDLLHDPSAGTMTPLDLAQHLQQTDVAIAIEDVIRN